jgi:hypothetical protein
MGDADGSACSEPTIISAIYRLREDLRFKEIAPVERV